MTTKNTLILSGSILLGSILIFLGFIMHAPTYQIIDGNGNTGSPAKILNVKTGEVFTHINGHQWLNHKSPK